MKLESSSSENSEDSLPSIANRLVEIGFENLWSTGEGRIGISKLFFQSALQLMPDLGAAHAGMARVLRFENDNSGALHHAFAAENKNPTDYHNLKIKAYILRDLGRLSESSDVLMAAASLEPKGVDFVVTELTARVIRAASKKEYEEGLKAILNSAKLLDADSWEIYRLGWWLLKKMGDHDRSQLVGVGRFVQGVGTSYFSCLSQVISVSQAEKYNFIKTNRIIDISNQLSGRFDANLASTDASDCARIVAISDGRCVSSRFGTAILAGEHLIEELSENDGLMLLERGLSQFTEIEGRVLNVAFPWGDGFFHFMMEIIPTIGLAHEEYGIYAFSKYYLRTRVQYQVDILAKIGIPEDRLIFSDKSGGISADELVTISNLVPLPPIYEARTWACHYVRMSLIGLSSDRNFDSKFVFIGRGTGTNGRGITNLSELSIVLKKHNIDTIYPETLQFSDQIALYKNVDLVVAPAGSALLNIVFCKPGTKILVIYQPKSKWRIYQSIAQAMGLEMRVVFGEPADFSIIKDPDWMEIDDNSDYRVNVNELDECITEMLVR